MKHNLHIVPHEDGWAIRLSGTDKPLSIHDTQQAAIEASIEVAEDDECNVVVHRRDGTFRNVIRYEAIERRLAEEENSRWFSNGPLVWGVFAAGALAGLAAILITRPPAQLRRWLD